jgi:hypothetical protein
MRLVEGGRALLWVVGQYQKRHSLITEEEPPLIPP